MEKIVISKLDNVDNDEIEAINDLFNENPKWLYWEGRQHALWIISNYGLAPASDDLTDNVIATQYMRCIIMSYLDIDNSEMVLECEVEDDGLSEEENMKMRCQDILQQMQATYEWDEDDAREKAAIAEHSQEVYEEAESILDTGDYELFMQHARDSGYEQ